MSEIIHFVVPGPPVPKARARVLRSGRSYTPAKTKAYEAAVRTHALMAMEGRQPYDGPVWLYITAFMPIPKSWPKWKREAAKLGDIPPTARPDLGNIVKAVEDAMNGVVYVDDAQIWMIQAAKVYSAEPQLRATVTFTRQFKREAFSNEPDKFTPTEVA